MGFAPRQWQKEARTKCVAYARQGTTRVLIYACPGAGKTLGSLHICTSLQKAIPSMAGAPIVVLCPGDTIKVQWIEEARRLFGIELLPVRKADDLLAEQGDLSAGGFVMTYQMARSLRHELKRYADRFQPILILDEVHHASSAHGVKGGNSWGNAVEDAFAQARYVLALTGTPWREDDTKIAFVEYDEDGKSVALASYGYASAMEDGVCRAVEFSCFDGEVGFRDEAGSEVWRSFTDPLAEDEANRRLLKFLSPDGKFVRRMIAKGQEKLAEAKTRDPWAAAMVVAIDREHALALCKIIKDVTGEDATLVLGDIADANARIARFRKGEGNWIVGVKMLSEGTDIKRLRVCVFCSNQKTSLNFYQVLGRIVRVKDSKDERAHFVLPADERLTAIAHQILEERYHALGDEPVLEVEGGARPGQRRKKRRGLDLTIVGSDGYEDEVIANGNRFPASFISEIRPEINRVREESVSLKHAPDAEIAQLLISLERVRPPHGEAA